LVFVPGFAPNSRIISSYHPMKSLKGLVLLFRGKKISFFPLFSILVLGVAKPIWAMDLDPFPIFSFSRDELSISLFRRERPSFYWTNIGVPDVFFQNVRNLSKVPNNTYSVQGIEYGVSFSDWVTDQFQARVTLPFEANSLQEANQTIDATGNTVFANHNLQKFGDVEVAGAYLLTGKRESGNFLGLDGWFRIATGSNPFSLAFPLLSTGKGADREAVGFVMGQQAGGFSFFQSIHYEKTQPINLASTNLTLGPGTFQWPDNWDASGRIEYEVFRQVQRRVTFFYQLQMRYSGLMKFNQQVLTYGMGNTTDRLFFSTGGVVVRVDKTFSAEGQVDYFPFEPIGWAIPRQDVGVLFSMSLVFRPD